MAPILVIAVIAAAAYVVMRSPGTQTGTPSDPNVAAFLALIRQSEGTAQCADPWGTIEGGAQFADKSCHPFEACGGRDALFTIGTDPAGVSSAAGAYQILLPTWNLYGGTAHYGDFSNASQDQCASDIIASCDKAGYVAAGNISAAQTELASQWASFTAVNLAANNAAYQGAGGNFVS